QVLEPLGEEIGRDARKAAPNVGIAARTADQKLTNDEEGPAITDHIECLGDGAVLTVSTHGQRYYLTIIKSSESLRLSTFKRDTMFRPYILLKAASILAAIQCVA